jgi:ACT domain-containing protein
MPDEKTLNDSLNKIIGINPTIDSNKTSSKLDAILKKMAEVQMKAEAEAQDNEEPIGHKLIGSQLRIPVQELTNAQSSRVVLNDNTQPVAPKDENPPVKEQELPPTAKKVFEKLEGTKQTKPKDKKEKKEKPQEPKSKLDTYLEALEKAGISQEEAIDILINVFYKNNFQKTFKILGFDVTFQIPPPEYDNIRFNKLVQIGPIYKQHEQGLVMDITLASALYKYGDKIFPEQIDGSYEKGFEARYEFVSHLNQYARRALFSKFAEFDYVITIVTQTDGVNDFFDSIRNRNI